jgi:hypothetical protein
VWVPRIRFACKSVGARAGSKGPAARPHPDRRAYGEGAAVGKRPGVAGEHAAS